MLSEVRRYEEAVLGSGVPLMEIAQAIAPFLERTCVTENGAILLFLLSSIKGCLDHCE